MPEATRPELLLLYLAKALRTFAFGGSSVVFAIYLQAHGFSATQIGFILAATLIEDALMTGITTVYANRLGAGLLLLLASAFIVLSGLILAFTNDPLIIAIVSILGIISPGGFEGGPFGAVEQTLVARFAPTERLAKVFSIYNLSGYVGAAIGSFIVGCTFPLLSKSGQNSAFSTMFVTYAITGVLLAAIYLMMNLKPQQSSTEEGV